MGNVNALRIRFGADGVGCFVGRESVCPPLSLVVSVSVGILRRVCGADMEVKLRWLDTCLRKQ